MKQDVTAEELIKRIDKYIEYTENLEDFVPTDYIATELRHRRVKAKSASKALKKIVKGRDLVYEETILSV